MAIREITVRGARQHNLKNVDVVIPRNTLTVITGLSGSGKSSLLRAGVLPALTKPEAVAGIALWRRCLIRPSEASNPIASLVAGLLREDALPEIGQEKSPAELMDLFRTAPDRAPAQIRLALGKAAKASGVAPSRRRRSPFPLLSNATIVDVPNRARFAA